MLFPNVFRISLMEPIESSFPGIGISTKSGSQFVSSIEITGMDMLKKRIKSESLVLGKHDKFLFESELENRKKLRG